MDNGPVYEHQGELHPNECQSDIVSRKHGSGTSQLSGLCTSASELIREALRLMAKQDTIRKAKTDLLGQEIQVEIGRGTATAWNPDEIRKAGREGSNSTSTRL
jgi:antitoxin ParD1/3/4